MQSKSISDRVVTLPLAQKPDLTDKHGQNSNSAKASGPSGFSEWDLWLC